jgi:hypothetical protein
MRVSTEASVYFNLCRWLESNSLIMAMDGSIYGSAIVEVTHYIGFFLLVGSIVIVDLRLLGVVRGRPTVTQLGEQVFPTMWTGLGLSALTGFIMFAGSATQYYANSVFYLKLAMVLLGIVAGIVIQRNVPKWDRLSAIPAWAKLLAIVSMALWIGAILVGVEVPAITGVG